MLFQSMANLLAFLLLPFIAAALSPSPALSGYEISRRFNELDKNEDRQPVDKSKIKDTSANMTWHPIGINANRIAVAWVQLKSLSPLNENSFRMNYKWADANGGQWIGRIDVNCMNKDYYIRAKGIMAQGPNWATIEKGSGVEGLAKIYCKGTNAASEWGYADATRYLWDHPAPAGDPGMAEGDWIQVEDTDELETYYNADLVDKGDYIFGALWWRLKKGDRSAAQGQDSSGYFWLNVSCKNNLYSSFNILDQSVPGTWLPPQPGRPGGAAMTIRKAACK